MFQPTVHLDHLLKGVLAIDAQRNLCLVRGSHGRARRPRWWVFRYDSFRKLPVRGDETPAPRYGIHADDLDHAIELLNNDERTKRRVAAKFKYNENRGTRHDSG